MPNENQFFIPVSGQQQSSPLAALQTVRGIQDSNQKQMEQQQQQLQPSASTGMTEEQQPTLSQDPTFLAGIHGIARAFMGEGK